MSSLLSTPTEDRRPRLVLASALALASTLLLAPTAGVAQGTAEQQEACTPDAVRLCSATIPDIGKTTACMKAHVADLSPRCRAAFASATAPSKAAAAPTTKTAKSPTRAASSRVEPRPHLAARGGRRPLAEESSVVTRVPSQRPVEPAPEVGAPPFPSPAAVAAIPLPDATAGRVSRSSLAGLCRNGLIDAFTCSSTIPTLGLVD